MFQQLKFLESVKKASEDYRVQCHKLQLSNTEVAASLEHREHEVERLRQELEEVENMRQVCMAQCASLRKEKEELEELYSDNQGSVTLYAAN